MNMEEKNINSVVERVIAEMMKSGILLTDGNSEKNTAEDGVFTCMDKAISAAAKAQKTLFGSRLELREKIISEIRAEGRKHVKKLSEMAVEETGMGRVEDKILKNMLTMDKTPGLDDLRAFAYSGDDGLTVMELSPYGVIGAITPSTNPTETVFCNAIGMIAAGNAVVFAPHPGAKEVSLEAVRMINRAVSRAGGPENLVVTVAKPSIESTNALIDSKEVKMLVATGGPGIVNMVMSSGKKAIGAGAGNPPAFVDGSADIGKAAKDIVDGASFDNNLPCIAEKVVVVEEGVKDYLIFEMQKNGAYLIKERDLVKKLEDMVMKNDHPSRDFVGRDAAYILSKLGIDVPKEIRLIIFEGEKDDLLAKEEQLMPILPIVQVKNAAEGIEVSKELEAGQRHTAIIHSKNIDVLTRYARELETTILVKNGPCYSGIGVGGEGYTTFTIAGPTGEGLTSARSFARNRRCTLVGGFSIK